ncbi:putative quinol monooxygenase [Streptomyces griseoruber]|uniref:putative quinol monooxygenase n=1 Tax=Streptomyces griseoruber TaxID=1943 RepID=UPI0012FE8508|nr:antibiotic biosynthesis monooxygenase [Streptomyces griseoruber]
MPHDHAVRRAHPGNLGCQAYVVHQDPEQPMVLRFFEIYDDEDALKAHGDYPHFTKYAVDKAAPALADRSHELTAVLDF